MATTLDALLKDPTLIAAELIKIQAGQQVVCKMGQNVVPVGTALDSNAVNTIVGSFLPADQLALLSVQAAVQFNVNIAGVGSYIAKVGKDAAGGYQAMLQKSSAVATPTPMAAPVSVAASPIAAVAPVAPPPLAAAPGVRKVKEIDQYFQVQLEMKASDIHLSSDVLPMARHDGEMKPMNGFSTILRPEDTERILWELMPEKNREEFKEMHDTDFAYDFGAEARFRCNVFMDRKGWGGVFRVIPSKILSSETLGLSAHILKLCYLTKGLVLVTGPTGSGKSTTLCAMIDYINRNRADHIITIEDPIEFVHPNKKCLINQREVHNHTKGFKNALRAALREDPDIILVGEMRDLETIAIAIEMAETGHLVFGTLHTSTAPSTVDRIIDQFPADRQSQIRVMLSESLKGVIAQTLCKKIGGGRLAALEVLIADHGIANLIRESKITQIPSAMQVGKAKGNVTLNDALMEMVKSKQVEGQEAYMKAVDKQNFETMLKRENIDLAFLNALKKEEDGGPPAAKK